MDYSKQRKAELKKYGLTIQQMVYGTLVRAGWNKADAYMSAFGESVTVSKEWVAEQVSSLDKDDNVNSFINEEINGKKAAKKEEKDLLQSLTKEETLLELARARNACTVGSKEWLDINKQIIEVNQLKKEELKTEDTTIHYFLPLQCSSCPLYMSNKEGDD